MDHDRTDQARLPALDGIRGLALVLVLLFHLDLPWARGGFLGVSMFFTLSGYLITSVLLRELQHEGSIDVRRFVMRRVRRLAPLAVVVVGGVVALWALLDDPTLATGVGGDARAALLQVANWHFVAGGTSYGDLFVSPTPLLHFWSLSVEVQMYVLWPLVLAVVWRLWRRRWTVGAVALALAAVSTAAWTVGDFDLRYYGTHTRAAEFLVGCALAAAPSLVRRLGRRRGLPLLAITALTALFIGAGHGTTVWSHGGFFLVAAATAVLISASGRGWVRVALGNEALAWIGRESYTFYVVHWPVFVLLSPNRTGWDDPTTLVMRLLVTTACVLVLSRLVDRPIMTRQVLRNDRWLATVSAVALIALAVVAVPALSRPTTTDASGPVFEPEDRVLTRDDTRDSIAPTTTVPEVPDVPVLLVGSTDSERLLVDPLEGSDRYVALDRRTVGCPVRSATAVQTDGAWRDTVSCPSVDLPASDLDQSDALLISVGGPDFGTYRIAAGDESGLRAAGGTVSVVRSLVRDARVAGRPVTIVLEPGANQRRTTMLTTMLGSLAAGDSSIRFVDDPARVPAALDELLGDPRTTSGRVLVVGDSTGAGLGEALFVESEQNLETMTLAQQGCPLIDVDRIRWWEGTEFDLSDCPDPSQVVDALSSFSADVVVVSSSLMEQAEYRDGDGEWFTAPSEEYSTRHALYLDDLARAAQEVGAEVVALDSPPLGEGAFGESPMGQPQRVAAWNAELEAWDARWEGVVLVPWSEWLIAYEAEHGSRRDDGVHLDRESQHELVRLHLLDVVERAVRRAS